LLVISYGIPKSGSTLAFEMLRGVLLSVGQEQEVFRNDRSSGAPREGRRNFLSEITREGIEELIAQVGPDRIVAAKTHQPLPAELFRWMEERQQAREVQVIASYRDPRDICLSLLDAGERARNRGHGAFGNVVDLEKAMANVTRRLGAFRRWAALRGTLRLRYDDVAFGPDKAIGLIENVLGVSSNRQFVHKYAFEEVHTLKNVAKPDRYVDELNDEEKQILGKTFRRFIRQVMERDSDRYFEKCRAEILEET
jgi:hypothetical protein